MNILFACLMCSVTVALLLIRGFRVYVRKLVEDMKEIHRQEIQHLQEQHQMDCAEIINKHQSDFAELINRINHRGPIPLGATSGGLVGIILLGMSRSIDTLLRLLEKREWNTREVITDLQQNVMVQLEMLHKTIDSFLKSRREILREFNKNQGL